MKTPKKIYTEAEKIKRRAYQNAWNKRKRENQPIPSMNIISDEIIIEIPLNLTFKIRFIELQTQYNTMKLISERQNIINELLSFDFFQITTNNIATKSDWEDYKHNIIGVIYKWDIILDSKQKLIGYRKPIRNKITRRRRKLVPPCFPYSELINTQYTFKGMNYGST